MVPTADLVRFDETFVLLTVVFSVLELALLSVFALVSTPTLDVALVAVDFPLDAASFAATVLVTLMVVAVFTELRVLSVVAADAATLDFPPPELLFFTLF